MYLHLSTSSKIQPILDIAFVNLLRGRIGLILYFIVCLSLAYIDVEDTVDLKQQGTIPLFEIFVY